MAQLQPQSISIPYWHWCFLKYVSDIFKAQGKVIENRLADRIRRCTWLTLICAKEMATELASDRDAYTQDNVFWVPEGARYEDLLAHIAADSLAQRLDKAMKAIEDENPSWSAFTATLGAWSLKPESSGN